jgi:hypothetical protein
VAVDANALKEKNNCKSRILEEKNMKYLPARATVSLVFDSGNHIYGINK